MSISQTYIRPVVRGKAAVPVEFGAKSDLSIDENGMTRLERLAKNAAADKKQNILAMQSEWRLNVHSVG